MMIEDKVVEILVQLDLRKDIEDVPQLTPPTILMAKTGECLAGWDLAFPVMYPSWEFITHFLEGVCMENYTLQEPRVTHIYLASTIPGPLW